MSKLYEKKDYYVNYLKNKDVDLSDHLDITNLEKLNLKSEQLIGVRNNVGKSYVILC